MSDTEGRNSGDPDAVTALRKVGLRDQLLTARGRLGAAEIASRAVAMTESLLAAPEVGRAACVAAYCSVGREPGTGLLLDALHERGVRVLLPLLRPDNDLDWAAYGGPGSLRSASRGLLEPVTPPRGVAAIALADLVLVPGLAASRAGHRLGRGGGSYDRALGRVPREVPVWVLLNSEELLPEIPHAPHDRPVSGAVTEAGVVRLG